MPRKGQLRRTRNVCFVTGSRAEFGLMESTLRAIWKRRDLHLQLVVTGTHTHSSRGKTVDEIRRAGWRIDKVINWADTSDAITIARETGRVSAALVDVFAKLQSEIVLVVGDRVEAFAAASAAHLYGSVVAHVHGGDRAMGQADDSLRHAITKLAHIHFPATRQSGERILRLGEEGSRVVVVGAPGIDSIRQAAASRREMSRCGLDVERDKFALLLLHPTEPSDPDEEKRTDLLIAKVEKAVEVPLLALLPNNDPGATGILQALHHHAAHGQVQLLAHVSRRLFLGLMRDCRLMIGNSSAGIIEAGSFSTPVVDTGPRQAGRERGSNVFHALWTARSISAAVRRALAWDRTTMADNPYDQGGAGKRIAGALARACLDGEFRRKLIRY